MFWACTTVPYFQISYSHVVVATLLRPYPAFQAVLDPGNERLRLGLSRGWWEWGPLANLGNRRGGRWCVGTGYILGRRLLPLGLLLSCNCSVAWSSHFWAVIAGKWVVWGSDFSSLLTSSLLTPRTLLTRYLPMVSSTTSVWSALMAVL